VYPETADFDILLQATELSLSRGSKLQPGDQIGIQAKLRANLDVLAQALPKSSRNRGPTHYAVLVPRMSASFREVAQRLGITVLWPTGTRSLQEQLRGSFRDSGVTHSAPCWVPDVEISTPEGVASPRSITPWKVSAVKLILLGQLQGYLLGTDFVKHGVHMQLWLRSKWVVAKGWAKHENRRVKYYELTDAGGSPHLRYPEVYKALVEGGVLDALGRGQ
jgi:hypothetical protein